MHEPTRSNLLKDVRPEILGRLVELQRRHVAVYSTVSFDPPIFYVPRFGNNIAEFTDSFSILFDQLKNRRVFVLYAHYSPAAAREAVEFAKLDAEHRRRYPLFTFIHLCNYIEQLERLKGLGLNVCFCNHNAFVDEKLFRPLSNVEKTFDAVYDARLMPFKRHHLAADLESLALIYYSVPTVDEISYMEDVKNSFAHAKFFNHSDSGEYKSLSSVEINHALNRCRVGLCLSAQEGAMFASIQYLLAGLPVVTTASIGGRDEFFDDENSITVEPDPVSVKRGVRIMIERNVDRDLIRRRTLERMDAHRQRFISLVQDIYDSEGIGRDFSKEWDGIFFNKLARNQKHIETLEMFDRGEVHEVTL
jgi:glycosyltransferase involved in cell wall biosynthesis